MDSDNSSRANKEAIQRKHCCRVESVKTQLYVVAKVVCWCCARSILRASKVNLKSPSSSLSINRLNSSRLALSSASIERWFTRRYSSRAALASWSRFLWIKVHVLDQTHSFGQPSQKRSLSVLKESWIVGCNTFRFSPHVGVSLPSLLYVSGLFAGTPFRTEGPNVTADWEARVSIWESRVES